MFAYLLAVLAGCNDAPSRPEVVVVPASPTTLDDIELVITEDAVDPDPGDSFTYEIRWTRNGERVEELDGEMMVPAASTAKGETWTVRVRAIDGKVGGAEAEAATTVVNTGPVVDAVTLPLLVDETTVVVPQVRTTDVDGDTVTWSTTWFVNGTRVSGAPDGLTGDAFDRDDTIFVEVSPHDGERFGPPVRSATVTVGNALPTFTDATVSPEVITETSMVSCIGAGFADLDDDVEAYVVQWTVNGGAPFSTETLTGDHYDKGDTVTCTLWAWDGLDWSDASRTVGPLTVQNTPPSVLGVVVAGGSPTVASDLTAAFVSLDDPDDDSITVDYSWKVDGIEVATSPALSTSLFSRGQEITVTVTPSDDEHAGNTVTSNPVTVGNALPTVATVAITPADARTTDDLTAQVDTMDLDDDDVTVSYAWFADGVPLGEFGPTLSQSRIAKGQEITVQVTPHDGLAPGVPVQSDAVTIANSTPTIAAVSVSPSPPRAVTPLTCVPAGWSDADDDDAGYTWRWTVGGVDVATTQTLDGSLFERGDSVSCAATPFDGEASGDEVSSGLQVVQNSAPVLTTATLSPATASETTTLTANPGSASDPDGDEPISYTFRWTVNQVEVGETGSTLDGTWFDRDDVVTVSITPTDGIDSGTPVTSNAVTIANTAPTVASVALSPDVVNTSTDLTATPAGSDIDPGDTPSYRYQWFLQDAGVGDFVELDRTEATLPSDAFDRNDVLFVIVTATDGSAQSIPLGSSTVTVVNAPPDAPTNVTLSSTLPSPDDHLVCSWDAATDPDGDTVIYDVTWIRDGTVALVTEETLLSSTLEGTETSEGERWRCEVAARDTEDEASTAGSSEKAFVTRIVAERLAAGRAHSCAIDAMGALWCWGDNELDQLMDGTGSDATEPVAVGGADDWLALAAGLDHTCAINRDGELWCGGDNAHGQLGTGSTDPVVGMVKVGTDDDWTQVGAGGASTCGIRGAGDLYCWGANDHGQLGVGDQDERWQPTRVGADEDWFAAVPGAYHTCASKQGGSLYCFGDNTTGAVGDGTNDATTVPVPVVVGADWRDVAVTDLATCSVDGLRGLWCWGSDRFVDATVPTSIHGASDWAALAAGPAHACAMSTAGELGCAGANAVGQLGDGSTDPADEISSLVPGTWSWMAVGGQHTCGIDLAGATWCWGGNDDGQLGDGSTDGRASPTPVDLP